KLMPAPYSAATADAVMASTPRTLLSRNGDAASVAAICALMPLPPSWPTFPGLLSVRSNLRKANPGQRRGATGAPCGTRRGWLAGTMVPGRRSGVPTREASFLAEEAVADADSQR